VQLYELFIKSARDKEHHFGPQMLAALPKSRREYEETINFQEFEANEDEEEKSFFI
jgi:hypothetical protein